MGCRCSIVFWIVCCIFGVAELTLALVSHIDDISKSACPVAKPDGRDNIRVMVIVDGTLQCFFVFIALMVHLFSSRKTESTHDHAKITKKKVTSCIKMSAVCSVMVFAALTVVIVMGIIISISFDSLSQQCKDELKTGDALMLFTGCVLSLIGMSLAVLGIIGVIIFACCVGCLACVAVGGAASASSNAIEKYSV
jgi:hypothetical protein